MYARREGEARFATVPCPACSTTRSPATCLVFPHFASDVRRPGSGAALRRLTEGATETTLAPRTISEKFFLRKKTLVSFLKKTVHLVKIVLQKVYVFIVALFNVFSL